MNRRRGRRPARAAVAPALLVVLLGALAGCGQLSPGTAATVGGTAISESEVDDVAAAQCTLRDSLTKQQVASATTAARVNSDSLGLLMDTELAKQFGEDQGIESDPTVAKTFLDQVLPLFEPLPAGEQADLTDAFRSWAQGRSILVLAGAKASGQQPTPQNLEQLLNAGLTARSDWLKKTDVPIETDARYSPGKDGFPGSGDGSVSKAGSAFAKDAAKAEQDPAFVSSLPSSQKCG